MRQNSALSTSASVASRTDVCGCGTTLRGRQHFFRDGDPVDALAVGCAVRDTCMESAERRGIWAAQFMFVLLTSNIDVGRLNMKMEPP